LWFNKPVLDKIITILKNECFLTQEKPILLGVSGGPDSLVLLDILNQAGYPLIVAHFNHKLRPEADIEATAVEHLASKMHLSHVMDSADVAAFARNESQSIEDAARTLRYRFLFTQARKFKAQAVAVGHTADDQVETVLMHFLRGAGLKGLKGMTYRTVIPSFDRKIPLVRPLLGVWRKDIIEYCDSHDLHPYFDPSNTSSDFFRNRLRIDLIPLLETYNPRIRETIWRTAKSLDGDSRILSGAVDDAWKAMVSQEGPGYIAFEMSILTSFSVGLQRNIFRRALEQLYPNLRDVDYSVIERAIFFLTDPKQPDQIDLTGGLCAFRERDQLFVMTREATLPINNWPQIVPASGALSMSIPGKIRISTEWIMYAELWDDPIQAWEQMQKNADPFRIWLDAGHLTGPVIARGRIPGDRFQPLGMGGQSIKLSDFFINVKLPRRARDGWPLLCTSENIIWIPGYLPAHPYRLTKATRQVVYLTLMKKLTKSNI
jgi:tRNA(Ile)-lysidine synthase